MTRFTGEILHQLLTGDQNLACKINDTEFTYREFAKRVAGIQSKLQRTGAEAIGIACDNSEATYAAIVACWLTGKCYVPVNLNYPAERIASIIEQAELQHILIAGEHSETETLKDLFPRTEFISCSNLIGEECFNTSPPSGRNAYILFTSGTTGKPKGVPITYGNLQAFLDGFDALGYHIGPNDRFLQMFELTFDLSIVSFLRPLMSGASFHTLPSGMIKTLGLYQVLEDSQITFSLMVPSAIGLLLPYLDDIHLPQLRVSQFCGEALKADLVQKWANCVPNARIDNVYGPTEATIYCTSLTINPKRTGPVQSSGIMAIGKPMLHCETAIFHESGTLVESPNTIGELCLSGNQVTSGYLKNPEQNQKSFVGFNQKEYYRTGDLVFKDEHGCLFYLGRTDDQIKIQGYRVELGEIENACSRILPGHRNVAVGFQDKLNNWHIALSVEQLTADEQTILDEVSALLPDYMKPSLILQLDEIPLNQNGKTDRKAIRQMAQKLFNG